MIEKILMKEIMGPVIVIIAAFIVYAISKKIIKRIFKFKVRGVDLNRRKTIMLLFTNTAKFFIIAIALTTILEIYGFDTKSLLASLGVFTAVAALALQDLLKDFVAGISLMLEGQYQIGDNITVNGFRGEVISLTLKSTRIKAYTGEIKIFANREITQVTNHTLDTSLAIVDIPVSYESNIEKVEKVLNELCERLTEETEFLKGPVELLGINGFGDHGIIFRITAQTEALKHFGIQRIFMREIKITFDKNHITIPYHQVVVHNGK